MNDSSENIEICYLDYPEWANIWVLVPKSMELDALMLGNVLYRIAGIQCTRKYLRALNEQVILDDRNDGNA